MKALCIGLLLLGLVGSMSESSWGQDGKNRPDPPAPSRQEKSGETKKQNQARPKEMKRPVDPVLAPVEDVAGLPRVLLIGDSISMGYTVPVRKMLEGEANVHRPLENCGPTTNGLKKLEKWLETGGADKKWDVIHFNWGLHDLKYIGADGSNLADPIAEGSHQQVPEQAYRENLQNLVRRLKKTGAKLIWRNTTPVPEGAKGRIPGDSVKYNQIAAEVMAEEGVPIHDLYSFAKERAEQIQRKADVHYTAEGSKVLAEQVVDVIRKALVTNQDSAPK